MNDRYILINNKKYIYEFYYRKNKNITEYDIYNAKLNYPSENNITWNNKDNFIKKIEKLQKILYDKKQITKSDTYSCVLCNKHVDNIIYLLNNRCWDNCLMHYISEHNMKPTDKFIEVIFRTKLSKTKKNVILNAKIKKYNNINYLKVDRNQFLIFDALLYYGGKKIYKNTYYDINNYYYSEHIGLLDFNKNGLDKIILSAKKPRIDEGDSEYFYPKKIKNIHEYEYIFHTHPVEYLGSRIKDGILFEFPSASDIFHFKHNYNKGITQGSMVVAPEGLYIIRKHMFSDNNKIIVKNENIFFNKLNKLLLKLSKESIDKHVNITNINNDNSMRKSYFYEILIRDTTFIDKINKFINKYNLHIDYFYRINDNNNWVIDTVYLPLK